MTTVWAGLRCCCLLPFQVRHVHGGVGRNIAECMATVGCPPLLISVVGKDAAGTKR